MEVEKDEVSMDHIKICTECGEYLFEGMDIYYIEINKLREDILLCENCINKLYYGIDKALDNVIK